MFEEPTFELDHQKLKDVVHYICSKCSPEELGNVKLHKILYFSDMLHFQSTGQPLTGVEYQKQKFGPTARHLGWAVGQLISENKLRSEDRDYYGFAKRAYISLSAPRNDRIGNVTHLLDDVIDFVCARSAKEISELSHNVAWESAELGEVIPYYTAIGLEPSFVSDDDLEWATREAHRIRPEIEAEQDAG